jgi:hypothetical protein
LARSSRRRRRRRWSALSHEPGAQEGGKLVDGAIEVADRTQIEQIGRVVEPEQNDSLDELRPQLTSELPSRVVPRDERAHHVVGVERSSESSGGKSFGSPDPVT